MERIGAHDRELVRLGREMRAAKKGSSTERFYKRRAIQVMKQKRNMERTLQGTMNMAYNMAAADDAVEGLALAAEIAPSLDDDDDSDGLRRSASAQASDVSIPAMDEAEELQDAYEDVLQNVHDVNEILARDFEIDREHEDAELEAELEAEMAAEAASIRTGGAGESAPEYLSRVKNIPAPPSERPSAYVPPPRAQGLSQEEKDAIMKRAQRRSSKNTQ